MCSIVTYNPRRRTETNWVTQVTVKVNLCFINFSLVDHFIVRKTLDEGLYMVYTFQVQQDRSKFLGINGTKLDIVVRLLLLVFWINRKHLLNYCVKRNHFLLTGFCVIKSSNWKRQNGEVAAGSRKVTLVVRNTRPTVFMKRGYLFCRWNLHILDMCLILRFWNLTTSAKKYMLLD